jgi:hypothetical protein
MEGSKGQKSGRSEARSEPPEGGLERLTGAEMLVRSADKPSVDVGNFVRNPAAEYPSQLSVILPNIASRGVGYLALIRSEFVPTLIWDGSRQSLNIPNNAVGNPKTVPFSTMDTRRSPAPRA